MALCLSCKVSTLCMFVKNVAPDTFKLDTSEALSVSFAAKDFINEIVEKNNSEFWCDVLFTDPIL